MIQRCLVVGPSWVGDMVMAQSLFIRLKADNPALSLAVLAPAWSEALLSRMPEVAETIVMPAGHGKLQLLQRWRLARELKQKGFDQAIILPGSFKAALIPFFAGITKRTAYVGELRGMLVNDIRQLDKNKLALNVERFLALGSATHELPAAIPRPQLLVDPELERKARKLFAIDAASPVLVLCPGAKFGPAKQWPAHHYAQVAQKQLDDGWQVILLGAKDERAVCEQINTATKGRCQDLAGKTTLPEVIDILSLADYVVSNDSGLMHIAAALARPLVAIYGSSSPDFTPPLSDNCHIYQLNLACQPCFKRVCPLGHTHCLQKLAPEQVISWLNQA